MIAAPPPPHGMETTTEVTGYRIERRGPKGWRTAPSMLGEYVRFSQLSSASVTFRAMRSRHPEWHLRLQRELRVVYSRTIVHHHPDRPGAPDVAPEKPNRRET